VLALTKPFKLRPQGVVALTRDPEHCSSARALWTPHRVQVADGAGGTSSPLHAFATSSSGSSIAASDNTVPPPPPPQQQCLTSAGKVVVPPVDPWCIKNNNMWRSNTDTLQTWTRIMVEVESMATQGHISQPGAWSFPDCLELGVAGQGTVSELCLSACALGADHALHRCSLRS
jgi:hypothetical protein